MRQQVTYYANYLRFCAHGREAALGAPLLRQLRAAGVRPVVLGIASCRLASPAVLGDVVAVRSHVIGADATTLTWRHSVAPAGAAPGVKPHAACDVTLGFADAAGALLPLPAALSFADAVPSSPALPPLAPLVPFSDNAPVALTVVTPFADELGPGGVPSDTDVLRWFERNRTDAIGGASGLRALQAAGVLVVVTSVGPVRLDPAAAAAAADAGEPLTVRSGVVLKRRATFIVFRQEVYDSSGALLAQGEVTCACVSAADMKLTPAPPALAERLAAGGMLSSASSS
jgi:acyl-CoA thioesterase FadM